MEVLRIAVAAALSPLHRERCSADSVLSALLRHVEGLPMRAFPDEREAARIAHCSTSTVRRRVRGLLGIGYREFRELFVLGATCDALRDTSRLIKEIARSAGYHSESAFARAFHAAFGLSPTEFRARLGHRPKGPAPSGP